VKSAQMHPLAQLVRLCFILILGLAAPAALNAHLAFIMLQLGINVLSADITMTLTEIPAKLTARI